MLPSLNGHGGGGDAMEPWQAALAKGDPDKAWDGFLDRYRPLILATIRRTLPAEADVFDVFADVCRALSADGLARLRRYDGGADRRARFSTWLVVVVRNQAIDWLRRSPRGRRPSAPSGLTSTQQEIFRYVFVEQRSHVEAYELLRAGQEPDLPFGAFLRELAETYRRVERSGPRGMLRYLPGPALLETQAAPNPEAAPIASEAGAWLTEALEALPADTRLALQLFVVEELPAAQVARAVGWPNAKTVYNRVYRAISVLRQALERHGIERDDL
jgi:RNA polymerase sigma factor (sigma-70 family)